MIKIERLQQEFQKYYVNWTDADIQYASRYEPIDTYLTSLFDKKAFRDDVHKHWDTYHKALRKIVKEDKWQ